MSTSLTRSKVIKGALAVGVLLLSTSILAILVYRERDVLLNYDRALRWEYIVAAFGLTMVAILLPAYVWTGMMRSLGSTLKWSDHFRYYFYSHVSRRLPGTVWYLLGRNYLYKQQGESMRLVTVASGIEFVIAVSSGAFVSLLFARFIWAQLSQIYLVLLFIALCLGAAATHPRMIQWSMVKMRMEAAPQIRYRDIIKWFLFYSVVWILGGVGLYLIANAVTVVPVADLPYIVGQLVFGRNTVVSRLLSADQLGHH